MSMVKITVPPQATEVVVTHSPEYGFNVAGGDAKVEEIEPRVVNVPVLDLPHYTDQRRALSAVPGIADLQLPDGVLAERTLEPPTAPTPADLAKHRSGGLPDCFSCDHPAHPGVACTWDMTGPDAEPGRECGCLRYVS